MLRLRSRIVLLPWRKQKPSHSHRALEHLSPFCMRKYSRYPVEGVFQRDSPTPVTPKLPPSPLEQQATSLSRSQFPGPIERRSRWRPHWYSIFGAFLMIGIGLTFARYGSFTIYTSLGASIPNLDQDEETVMAELEDIPMVQELRRSWHVVDGKREPLWQEWTAYEGFSGPDSRREQRLTSGLLGNRSGVAVQKVFWHERAQTIVVFINFGKQTVGIPSSVHRGLIATIFDETLGRLAIKSTTAKTAVTASLDVSFLGPVIPGHWYSLTVMINPDESSTDRKVHVLGELASCYGSRPASAVAKALFVVPKTIQLKTLEERF